MCDDFAVFILTHGRADNVVTFKTLERQGYTGRWYMVIDDEDDMAPVYRKNFGEDHVIQFCKRNAVDRADTMDNFDEHRAILYARNESFHIARKLGLKYFLMLDDDYSHFALRFPDGDKLDNQILIGEALTRPLVFSVWQKVLRMWKSSMLPTPIWMLIIWFSALWKAPEAARIPRRATRPALLKLFRP